MAERIHGDPDEESSQRIQEQEQYEQRQIQSEASVEKRPFIHVTLQLLAKYATGEQSWQGCSAEGADQESQLQCQPLVVKAEDLVHR